MRPPRFLLDRSLGQRKLVALLRSENWDVTTLAERFGDAEAQRMSDETWIGEGTREGFVLLVKDQRVAQRPIEARAIYMHDARVITFSRGDRTAEQMGELCLKHASKVFRMATSKAPFVVSLSERGLTRKNLNWPID